MNNPPSNPQAVIYGRLSKGDASLESHEQRNLAYVEFQKFKLLCRYEDEDTSGGVPLLERPGGMAMINRLRHGDVRHLVVAKLDRLGRWARDVLDTIETLQALKVTLHIVDFGGDTITTQGHMGKLILTLFAGIAEWERSEIRDRTRKRAQHKFDKGELIGTVPFGYDAEYVFADGHKAVTAVAYNPEDLAILTRAHGAVTSKRLVDNCVQLQRHNDGQRRAIHHVGPFPAASAHGRDDRCHFHRHHLRDP